MDEEAGHQGIGGLRIRCDGIQWHNYWPASLLPGCRPVYIMLGLCWWLMCTKGLFRVSVIQDSRPHMRQQGRSLSLKPEDTFADCCQLTKLTMT